MMFKDLANALPWMETACKAGKAVVTFVLNLIVTFVLTTNMAQQLRRKALEEDVVNDPLINEPGSSSTHGSAMNRAVTNAMAMSIR